MLIQDPWNGDTKGSTAARDNNPRTRRHGENTP